MVVVIDPTQRDDPRKMPLNKTLYAQYPQHTPRSPRPPARALLVSVDTRALGLVAGWARSAGCDIGWTHSAATVFDTPPHPLPDWWVIDLDGWPDPVDMLRRLARFRLRHPRIQVLLVLASLSRDELGHDMLPLCDAVLHKPLTCDQIEGALHTMQRTNQMWQTQAGDRTSPRDDTLVQQVVAPLQTPIRA